MRVNAVFEGGGVKGIGLVGAVAAAENLGITFNRTAGTSVGALVAALLAAGFNATEMRDIVLSTPYRKFTQEDFFYRIPIAGPAVRLLIKKGLYSGDYLEHWVAFQLARKGVITFGDLPEDALRVVASDISQGKMLLLPDDIAQYGTDPKRFSVAKAIRMSTSLPYFFDPVILSTKPKSTYYIVDGGILSNYPLWIFDKEMNDGPPRIPIVGFQLVGKKHAEPKIIRGPVSMFDALFTTMLGAHDERYIEEHNRFRTVKIPSDMVHTTEFSITKEKALELYNSGYQAGEAFFRRWSYAKYVAETEKWSDKIRHSMD